MYYSFSDGTTFDIPDMCGYCELTTGGQHQWNCLAFPPIYFTQTLRNEFTLTTNRNEKQYEAGGFTLIHSEGDRVKITIRKYDRALCEIARQFIYDIE